MTKKVLLLSVLILSSFSVLQAGGILTNTNQSARFARLFALDGYTCGAEIAYYNPAGTIKLSEGFHFTISNQSVSQKRIINSTFSPYSGGLIGEDFRQYVGTATAPIVPSIQGVYRVGSWALSGSIAVVGGGGKATFNDGLSMFESELALMPLMLNNALPIAKVENYDFNTYMTGSNFIYGAQLGGAYKINDMWSVYGGFRLNIVHNNYKGYLTDVKINPKALNAAYESILGDGSMVNAADYLNDLANNPNLGLSDEQKMMLKNAAQKVGDRYIDSKQSGWGVAPVIGVNFSWRNLNIGTKFEFQTNLDVENHTKLNQDAGLEQFKDGVNTAHNIPALFTFGAQYKIIEPLTILVSYHHFFDKNAKMAGDKQKSLKRGTNEYLMGAEYQLSRLFGVSMGGQITRYGLSDEFQSDLSFYCNSYSMGFGGFVNVSPNAKINIGYFFTKYDRYNKIPVEEMQPVNIYDRKNKVFTVGVDFSF